MEGRETVGLVLKGSYNTFLNQESKLVVVNSAPESSDVFLSLTRSSGDSVVSGLSFSVPGNGSIEVSLNNYELPNNYGVVTLHSAAGNNISAWVKRRQEDNYSIPTILR